MIKPILNYGCEVMGLRRSDPVDTFRRVFFYIYILRVNKLYDFKMNQNLTRGCC